MKYIDNARMSEEGKEILKRTNRGLERKNRENGGRIENRERGERRIK